MNRREPDRIGEWILGGQLEFDNQISLAARWWAARYSSPPTLADLFACDPSDVNDPNVKTALSFLQGLPVQVNQSAKLPDLIDEFFDRLDRRSVKALNARRENRQPARQTKAESALLREFSSPNAVSLRWALEGVAAELGAVTSSTQAERVLARHGIKPDTTHSWFVLHHAGRYELDDRGWLIDTSRIDGDAITAAISNVFGDELTALETDLLDTIHNLGVSPDIADEIIDSAGTIRRLDDDTWIRWEGSNTDRAVTVLTLAGYPLTVDEIAKHFADARLITRNRLLDDDRIIEATNTTLKLAEWRDHKHSDIADEHEEDEFVAADNRLLETVYRFGIHPDIAAAMLEASIRRLDETGWDRSDESIANRAVALLTLVGYPLTTAEIADHLNEADDQSTRSTLLADDRIIEASGTKLGLVEWGHKDYTLIADAVDDTIGRRNDHTWVQSDGSVTDRAVTVLTLAGYPLTTAEIAEHFNDARLITRYRLLDDDRIIEASGTKLGLAEWGHKDYTVIADEPVADAIADAFAYVYGDEIAASHDELLDALYDLGIDHKTADEILTSNDTINRLDDHTAICWDESDTDRAVVLLTLIDHPLTADEIAEHLDADAQATRSALLSDDRIIEATDTTLELAAWGHNEYTDADSETIGPIGREASTTDIGDLDKDLNAEPVATTPITTDTNVTIRNVFGDDIAASHDELLDALYDLGVDHVNADEILTSDDTISRFDDHTWIRSDGSVTDRAVAALTLADHPLTVDEIADHLNDTDGLFTRSTLLADDRIIRASKTKLGLADWGHNEYTGIVDELFERIDRDGGSSDKEDLVAELLNAFDDISETSVRLYMSTLAFVTDSGRIRRRTGDDDWPIDDDFSEIPGVFVLADKRVRVVYADKADMVSRSARSIPQALAVALGMARPGDPCEFFTDSGDRVEVVWQAHSTGGPQLGSLRALATSVGVGAGDRVAVDFYPDTGRVAICVLPSIDDTHFLIELLDGTDEGEEGIVPALAAAIGVAETNVKSTLQRRGDRWIADLIPAPATDSRLKDLIADLVAEL